MSVLTRSPLVPREWCGAIVAVTLSLSAGPRTPADSYAKRPIALEVIPLNRSPSVPQVKYTVIAQENGDSVAALA